ncbi:MAG TPA: hypothetical protein VFG50_03445 [Rhodothermales bacterium]|nr:hypothetical protein [Rhodothermales bacterium]
MTRNTGRFIVVSAACAGALVVAAAVRPEALRVVQRVWPGRGGAGHRARDMRSQLDAAEVSLWQLAAAFRRSIAAWRSGVSQDWGLDRGDVIEDLPRLPHGKVDFGG